jgi:hypothetical protein
MTLSTASISLPMRAHLGDAQPGAVSGSEDVANAVEVGRDVACGNKGAELPLSAHVEANKLPALSVGLGADIPPAQIPRFRRPHARVGHDQDEVVGHGPIPCAEIVARLLDPATREAVQLAVFG